MSWLWDRDLFGKHVPQGHVHHQRWDLKTLQTIQQNVWINLEVQDRQLSGETEQDFKDWTDEMMWP